MKIFAAGLSTETNTFSPMPTGLADYQVQRGEDALEGRIINASLDLSALWAAQAKSAGAELIFGLMAQAQPAGLTVRSAYETLRDELLGTLRCAMPVDIVLLMLHGAMVAQGYDSCEEDIIQRIREIVGPDAVLAVELDLHCHVREALLEPADIILTFKEYPHIDVNDRARELFDLAVATHRDEVRPVMALFECRMVGMYPTSRQPMAGCVQALIAAETQPGVLSVSLGHGFQFADLPHVGTKVLVVTDNDPPLARRLARELGMLVYGFRHEISFASFSLPMEEALSRALTSPRGPVVVADQSDNVGGGAPGDATYVLRWLLDHQVTSAATALLYDPEVVRIARKAGVGASIALRVGGKLGRSSGEPLDIEARVLDSRDDYVHEFPQRCGEPALFPIGDAVALDCHGVDVIVASERCQCFSPSIFNDFGIDPRTRRLLIPKSYQHFHEAFSKIATDILYMAGPGAVPPDPRQIPYRRLDTARLFPWVHNPFG